MTRTKRTLLLRGTALALLAAAAPIAAAQSSPCAGAPWMDAHRSADQRTDLLLGQMTLDEKVSMLHAVFDGEHARETLPIAR